MRSKQLSWSAAVVSLEDYHQAVQQAIECCREAKRFEQQRLALRRYCVHGAAKLTGVIYGSIVEHDFGKGTPTKFDEILFNR